MAEQDHRRRSEEDLEDPEDSWLQPDALILLNLRELLNVVCIPLEVALEQVVLTAQENVDVEDEHDEEES